MSDAPPTDEELRQAQALADALEGRDSARAPDDALATAQLLRHAQGKLDPDPARLEEIRKQLEQRVRFRRRRVALGIGAALAIAASLLLFVPMASRSAAPKLATTSVVPDRALLEAQARAITSHDLHPLDAEMRRYRMAMLTRAGARP